MKRKHFQNPEFCKALGQHIRKLREERGIGMREFADRADIEYSRLAKIEHGRTNPTISTLIRLADELGVTHQELFDFKYPNSDKRTRTSD